MQVAAAARFFDGEIGAAQREIERRRDTHSAAQRFEAAARAQRDLELIRRMRRRQRAMSWIVERQHFAVMQPTADGGRALLYAVAHGRLIARATASDPEHLTAFAARVQGELALPGKREIQPEDVEGTIILAAWLRSRGESDGYVFRLSEDVPVAAQLAEWGAALATIVQRSNAA